MTAIEIEAKNKEELARNPSIDFSGIPNLATQTGAKSIPQMIEEFERAGRAIMVAEADANFPETPGMRLYPDPIEAILLEREVNAELMIARKRLAEDQEQARKNEQARLENNEKELKKIQASLEAGLTKVKNEPVT